MKKSLLFTAIIFLLLTNAKAQLANTKWMGKANLLQQDNTLVSVSIEWNFGKDTVAVSFAQGGEPEVLAYTEKDNIVSFAKISGGSPCEQGAEAKYKFRIDGDKLYFTLIETKCEAFSKALDDKPYTREK